MRTQNKPWLSPISSCPFCKKDLIKLDYFIDGATTQGPWALMCKPCHIDHGVGLGLGLGQMYKKNEEDNIYYQV